MFPFNIISSINSIYAFGANISKTRQILFSLINRNKDFYVTKHYKKCVIYKDGHGIIENSYDFVINKSQNFKCFYRE